MTVPPAAKPERCPECGAPGDRITWERGSPPYGHDYWRCGHCGAPWSTPGMPRPGQDSSEDTDPEE
jgi:ribosomal protein L37AE/L43A